MTPEGGYDVVVVGGGPGGSTTGAFLAKAGWRVLLFEREVFPRFHVGESLLPATLPILERLGVLKTIAERGFQLKIGATFHDQESGFEHTFHFLRGKPWPSYAYQVPRAEFDAVLLEHAKVGIQPRVVPLKRELRDLKPYRHRFRRGPVAKDRPGENFFRAPKKRGSSQG